MYAWALDHRVHHKYTETDADPHNAKRGFFFAHVGWLFTTPHPDVVAKREAVDMSDLEADPIVMWQKRYVYKKQKQKNGASYSWKLVKSFLKINNSSLEILYKCFLKTHFYNMYIKVLEFFLLIINIFLKK